MSFSMTRGWAARSGLARTLSQLHIIDKLAAASFERTLPVNVSEILENPCAIRVSNVDKICAGM